MTLHRDCHIVWQYCFLRFSPLDWLLIVGLILFLYNLTPPHIYKDYQAYDIIQLEIHHHFKMVEIRTVLSRLLGCFSLMLYLIIETLLLLLSTYKNKTQTKHAGY